MITEKEKTHSLYSHVDAIHEKSMESGTDDIVQHSNQYKQHHNTLQSNKGEEGEEGEDKKWTR